jgi:putative sterol carrier protein
MAEQPPVSENVTPEQFFEQLLPMGFAAQTAAGGNTPQDFTLQYHLTGAGGGDWLVTIAGAKMTTRKGSVEDANLTFTLSTDDWRDAVVGRNGATVALILPQSRPGRPDNSARARQLKGTMALELGREGAEPYRQEMCFNGGATPRSVMKMKLADYLAMQEGRLNGQEAFMTGKLKIEGDLGFLMQLAALTA